MFDVDKLNKYTEFEISTTVYASTEIIVHLKKQYGALMVDIAFQFMATQRGCTYVIWDIQFSLNGKAIALVKIVPANKRFESEDCELENEIAEIIYNIKDKLDDIASSPRIAKKKYGITKEEWEEMFSVTRW
jgi:hypothetical protein